MDYEADSNDWLHIRGSYGDLKPNYPKHLWNEAPTLWNEQHAADFIEKFHAMLYCAQLHGLSIRTMCRIANRNVEPSWLIGLHPTAK